MAVKLAKQGPMKRLNINLYGQENAETKYREWQEAIKQTKTACSQLRLLIKYFRLA